jgi:hypothetical protein
MLFMFLFTSCEHQFFFMVKVTWYLFVRCTFSIFTSFPNLFYNDKGMCFPPIFGAVDVIFFYEAWDIAVYMTSWG